MEDHVRWVTGDAARHLAQTGRPLVTLSYAQSLDGSLTLTPGQPAPVSSAESMRITHQLRAAHDAILIGIGTLLADDPRLTPRLAGGPAPQPVVLDSRLRFPPGARLLAGERLPWVAATPDAPPARQRKLESAGARVLRLPADTRGRINLTHLLDVLGQSGIASVMVEGGAAVITSFLQARLADRAVITVSPVFAGGLRAVGTLGAAAWGDLPRLDPARWSTAGCDAMVWGVLAYGGEA